MPHVLNQLRKKETGANLDEAVTNLQTLTYLTGLNSVTSTSV